MARLTFTGGIHPYSGKDLSKDRKIREVFPFEGKMFFPLKQHIGEPAVPVVSLGEYVCCGQLIARADGELSANLHSPVSGRVVAMEDVPDISGFLPLLLRTTGSMCRLQGGTTSIPRA